MYYSISEKGLELEFDGKKTTASEPLEKLLTGEWEIVKAMKPQEAIERIQLAVAEVEWNNPIEYCIAFKMAIDALEKQIPKPLRKLGRGMFATYMCPYCGGDKVAGHYCVDCGQAFSFEEVEK
jgi:hypothetical protein